MELHTMRRLKLWWAQALWALTAPPSPRTAWDLHSRKLREAGWPPPTGNEVIL
jgi:hypothetical protein